MVRTLRVCMGLIGENRNAKLIYLAITSRLLDKQVSIVIKGLSSSGKSYTIECVALLFPPEAIYTMTAMSEHAQIYLDENLSHRTLILLSAREGTARRRACRRPMTAGRPPRPVSRHARASSS